MDKITKVSNNFSQDLQLNARTSGKYDNLAGQIESEKCVFCDLREKYIIKEKNGLVLTVNIFPYINGHLMIIPRRHIENFSEVTKKEFITYQELCNEGMNLLKKKMDINDFWLLLRDGTKVGKTVKHLHWHIIPFYEELVTKKYKEITIAPIDIASKLRNINNRHEGN